jgi:hypothetical protein
MVANSYLIKDVDQSCLGQVVNSSGVAQQLLPNVAPNAPYYRFTIQTGGPTVFVRLGIAGMAAASVADIAVQESLIVPKQAAFTHFRAITFNAGIQELYVNECYAVEPSC